MLGKEIAHRLFHLFLRFSQVRTAFHLPAARPSRRSLPPSPATMEARNGTRAHRGEDLPFPFGHVRDQPERRAERKRREHSTKQSAKPEAYIICIDACKETFPGWFSGCHAQVSGLLRPSSAPPSRESGKSIKFK